MEDIINALRERNEDVPVPLDLPEFDDLVNVEEQLLLPLTPEYRDFLLEVSDVVYGRIEPGTAVDPSSHTYLPEIAAFAWDQGVPREYLPICEDAGQFYCLAQDETIKLWRDGEFADDEWNSVWQWARDIWLEGDI